MSWLLKIIKCSEVRPCREDPKLYNKYSLTRTVISVVFKLEIDFWKTKVFFEVKWAVHNSGEKKIIVFLWFVVGDSFWVLYISDSLHRRISIKNSTYSSRWDFHVSLRFPQFRTQVWGSKDVYRPNKPIVPPLFLPFPTRR